jgi:general secretion pathway protein H
MPRSAPGSSGPRPQPRRLTGSRRGSASGFTLIELLIVVVLIAVASSLASLALRDPATTTLEREGARLVALLEGARAEARASGLAAYWEPQTQNAEVAGFRFVGLSPSESPTIRWLDSGVSAEVVNARAVILGPEPLIGAQRIVLRLRDQRLTLATDGLGPFAAMADTEAPAPQ